MSTVEVTDQSFQSEVIDSDLPVLVDFWATWCAPCRQVAPVLEELSDELAGQIKIAKVDVDQNPMISQALRIQSIPTMVVFANGQPVDAAQGALPKQAILDLLAKHMPEGLETRIKVPDLVARLEAGLPVQVFDIRDPRDFSRSHLRRARCVPAAELPAAMSALPHGTLVVLIDRTGEHAEEVAQGLTGGSHHVVALDKGLLEWEGSGAPTYNDREEAALDASGEA